MKTSRIVPLSALTFAFMGVAGTAYASPVIIISGVHSKQDIKAACSLADQGHYVEHGDGAYGCSATGGTVTCDQDGKCTGETNEPAFHTSMSIKAILTPQMKSIGR